MKLRRTIVLAAVATLALASRAHAWIAVSANDNKVTLDNGVVKVVPNAPPDTVSIIDLTAKPPRVVDTIGVLGATAEGLKISPDGSIVAVVVHHGSSRAKDSPFYNDGGKLVLVRVSGKALSRVAEAPIDHWSQGVAFAPDGRTILVGNMVEKDYWVFQWDGRTLRDTGQRAKVNGGPAAIRTADR